MITEAEVLAACNAYDAERIGDDMAEYPAMYNALLAARQFDGYALSLISAEYHRQREVEGWTPEHDDEHGEDQMACAAACYAMGESEPERDDTHGAPRLWPWAANWWKPGDGSSEGRVRELVKAGALIVAEIERYQRAASDKETEA